MKRKLKQRCSKIPPIPTKQTIASHLNLQNTKKDHNLFFFKSRSLLETGTKCGRFKPVSKSSTMISDDILYYLFSDQIGAVRYPLCVIPVVFKHRLDFFLFFRPSQSNKKPLVTGHPKMERLEQVVLDHFNTFNKGLYVKKLME